MTRRAETEQTIDIAHEAVADAMLLTQAQMLLPLMGRKNPDANPETYLARVSAGKCGRGAIFATAYLTEKYLPFFRYIFIVTTFQSNYLGYFKDKQILHHSYFLTQSHTGTWYAGSPANHNTQTDTSPLTTVLTANSLDSLFTQIEACNGGQWPTANFLDNTLTNHYEPPKIETSPTNEYPLLTFTFVYSERDRFYAQQDTVPIISNFSLPIGYYHD